MESNHIAAAFLGLVLVVIVFGGIYMNSENSVNCENQYDRAINEGIEPEDISEECRPVPEEVEKKLLIQALGEAS